MTGCPLLYDYNKYGILATNTWTKMIREKIGVYGIEVSLNYPKTKQPRGSCKISITLLTYTAN